MAQNLDTVVLDKLRYFRSINPGKHLPEKFLLGAVNSELNGSGPIGFESLRDTMVSLGKLGCVISAKPFKNFETSYYLEYDPLLDSSKTGFVVVTTRNGKEITYPLTPEGLWRAITRFHRKGRGIVVGIRMDGVDIASLLIARPHFNPQNSHIKAVLYQELNGKGRFFSSEHPTRINARVGS